MIKKGIGTFLILHGLVYALYGFIDIFPALGTDLSVYETTMGWTGSSWLFSPFLNDSVVSLMAFIFYIVATIAFVIAGIIFMTDSDLWRVSIILACLIGSLVLILFWDGSFEKIINKGVIGLGINLVVAIVVWQK